MATLKIPPVLRTEAGGVRLIEVGGGTVREALDELVAAHPRSSGGSSTGAHYRPS